MKLYQCRRRQDVSEMLGWQLHSHLLFSLAICMMVWQSMSIKA
jgi:hypothetical protein